MNTTPGTTLTLTLAGEEVTATWCKLADFCEDFEDMTGARTVTLNRPTFVVEGPDAGFFWRDENSVVGVREVRCLMDKTFMEVEFTNGAESSCTWSGARFLVVDAVPC